MRIFLSYGHDRFAKLAEKLKRDLEADGHQVWFDQCELHGSAEWELEIEQGIMSTDWLILMMTDHSVRRPDGVCLDEVSKARFNNKSILPLMIQQVEPPFCITRVQWIDMMSSYYDGEGRLNTEVYARKLSEIKDIIAGVKRLDSEGEQAGLIGALSPMDNDVYYNNFRRDFFGRGWLLEEYRKWVSSDRSPKVFLILGKGGSGKTAFVASLCSRQPEVVGIHFCKYNDSGRSDPKRALASLAYHMSTQLPEYRRELLRCRKLDNIYGENVTSIFESLFTTPLSNIRTHRNCVLIIDALDEAQNDADNNLLQVLSTELRNTPDWLKFLVTSRPVSEVVTELEKYDPIVIEGNENNIEDVRGYVIKKLTENGVPNADTVAQAIVDHSQGNFLYASETVKAILDGSIDPEDTDSYPSGLNETYRHNFDRMFRKNMEFFKNNVRPFLEILVSCYRPTDAYLLLEMAGVDEYDMEEVLGKISSMFPMNGNHVSPMHKSVYDWLIDRRASKEYFVSLEKGHKRIAEKMDLVVSENDISDRVCRFIVKHNLKAKRFKEASEYMIDSDLQEKRIKILGTDSSAYEYFRELKELHRADSNLSSAVMNSDTFLYIFEKLADHIMHMGMYPVLRECGFDEVAEHIRSTTDSWRMKHLIALYYYTTARTRTAMEIFIDIRTNMPPGYDDDILSGVSDMLGLSYKKYVEFDKAEECLLTSAKIAPNRRVGASSMVNLSKIYYHLLRWDEAVKWVTDGIEELQRYIDDPARDDDEKRSAERFKSEFYRIKVEVGMWKGDIDICDENFREADRIHMKYDIHDQYQPRYRYTKLFVDTIKGKDIPDREFERSLAMEMNTYDRERNLFYRGIYRYVHGDETGAMELFRECLPLCEKIELTIETAEVYALMKLCGESVNKISDPIVARWTEYVEQKFSDLRRLIENHTTPI